MTDTEGKKFVELETKLEMFMDATKSFRLGLTRSIERIEDKLNNLPCEARNIISDNFKLQLKVMWSLVILMVAAIVNAYFRR